MSKFIKFLSSFKIATRLILSLGLIFISLCVIVLMAIREVGSIDDALTEMIDTNAVKQRYAINFRGSVHDRAIAIRDVYLSRTDEELKQFTALIDKLASDYKKSSDLMDELAKKQPHTSKEAAILNKIASIRTQTLALVNEVVTLRKQDQHLSAHTLLLDKVSPSFVQWLNTINEFIDLEEHNNITLTKQIRDSSSHFTQFMIRLLILSLVMTIIITFLIERSFNYSIYSSLGDEPHILEKSIKHLAGGNLMVRFKHSREGSVSSSLDEMQQKLSETMGHITESADEVESRSSQITHCFNSTTDNANKQGELTAEAMSYLEDMRNKMEEMSESLHETQDNITRTTSYSDEGLLSIEKTQNQIDLISVQVSQAVEQIRKLEQKSKEISGIASVISGISDQTNLLALNAAIEAARAGDSGRGFAVVADEVRTLAQRTGEATEQIENMLVEVQKESEESMHVMEQTLPKIESGSSSGRESAEALKRISTQAHDSLNKVSYAVEISQEQSNQINKLVGNTTQINSMSQEIIDKLRNNNESVEKLCSVATVLSEQVAYFQFE